MCTGLCLSTKDGKHFFGRNLDVPASYNQSVQIVPKNFKWLNVATQETVTAKYACIAMGIVMDNHPLLFYGVNEKGLAGGGLNFTQFAKFSPTAVKDKNSLSASDFVYWVLSTFSSLSELKETLPSVILTSIPFKPDLPVAGLHWIFTDKTGESIVIEYMEDGMHIHDNPVGVLTNDPTFDWQLTNLSQYVTLSCKTPQPEEMGNLLVKPFGHGLGMCGIPGDGSPAARFVRTVFFRDAVVGADDEISGVTAFFNVLSEVTVMKGSEIDPDGSMNFTVYKSAMCQESQTYYYTDYYNRRINAVKLTPDTMNADHITTFPYLGKQDICYQN